MAWKNTDTRRPDAVPEVREHLERIVASAGFRSAPRLQAFLRFVVGHALDNTDSEIKEASVGVEVYGKQPGYDPRIDSTVRVEASKLRQRLAAYYKTEGAEESIRISIPKGGYVATIEWSEPEVPWARWRWWQAGAAAVLFAAAVWLLWPAAPPPVVDPGALRISRLTAQGTLSTDAAVSPGGDFVVYASDFEGDDALNLWKQPLDGSPAARLTRSKWSHSSPAISRAGAVVFRTSEDGGMLATVGPGPGAPHILKNTARARDPRFSPAAPLLAYWVPADEETRDYGSVFLQDLADPRVAPVRLFGEFAHAARPIWHDGATHLLVAGTWRPEVPEREFDVWVLRLNGTHPVATPIKSGLFPLLAAAGFYSTVSERRTIEIGDWRGDWLYFTIPSGEARDLYRIRLDANSGVVSGRPQRLTLGSSPVTGPRLTRDGLVFAETETSIDLYSLAEPASQQPSQDLRRHTAETGTNFRHSIDANASTMAWERRRTGALDEIWAYSLSGHRGHQLATTLKRATSHVVLTPDGAGAAYHAEAPNSQPIYFEPLAGGPPRLICPNCGAPSDWSPDASHLWYITGGKPASIGLLDVKTGKSGDSLSHPSYSLYGARQRVNAKGDGWLAFYVDNGPRTRQIYLAPLRAYQPSAPESWIAATTGANWDLSPAWAANGNRLYFVSRRDGYSCIMAQDLDPATKRPLGPPWIVRHFHDPGQTLMRTRTNRGADALWIAAGRIFFMLDRTTSSLRLLSGLKT